MRRLFLAAFLLLLGSHASALSSSARAVIYGQRQSFPLLLDFVHDTYYHNGSSLGALSSFTTATRNNVANMDNVAGIWTSFNANVARRSDKGLRVETTRTNIVKWDRDLTNIAWVAVNVTAAKDQAGIDGVTNSASSITASSTNGTILQTIVNTSSARVQSAFVRRITGTGTINETMDCGVTWVAIAVTATWTQLQIPTQTLANPCVGFQIATSGDAIAVDAVQNENNNTGDIATAPIFTTTTNVQRNIDQLVLTTPTNFADVLLAPRLTVIVKFTVFTTVPGGNFFSMSDGSTNNRYTYNFNSATQSDGLSGLTVVVGGVPNGYDPLLNTVSVVARTYCFAAATDQVGGFVGVTLNGNSKEYANTSWPAPSLFTNVSFGELLGGGPMYGYLQALAATPAYLTAGQRRRACEGLAR